MKLLSKPRDSFSGQISEQYQIHSWKHTPFSKKSNPGCEKYTEISSLLEKCNDSPLKARGCLFPLVFSALSLSPLAKKFSTGFWDRGVSHVFLKIHKFHEHFITNFSSKFHAIQSLRHEYFGEILKNNQEKRDNTRRVHQRIYFQLTIFILPVPFYF